MISALAGTTELMRTASQAISFRWLLRVCSEISAVGMMVRHVSNASLLERANFVRVLELSMRRKRMLEDVILMAL